MKFAPIALLVFATAALAQDSTSAATSATASSTAGISACILQCSSDAASSNGCSSITDLQCVCTSASFQDDAKSCLQDNCTEEEQQAALQLQAAECAAIGGSSESGSAATSTGTSASSSASSASNSASSASRTRTSSGSSATSTGPSSTTSNADASATDSNAASGLHHEFFLVGGVVAPVIAV
ncbi:hypothetical protein EV122DRAFT_258828, partial [Schizophyllum commune]